MTTREEHETTVTFCAADDLVRIYSSYPPHVRQMREDDAYHEVRGGARWAEFEIPQELFNPMRGRRRPRALSDEQRVAAADRMRELRAIRAKSPDNYQGRRDELAAGGSEYQTATNSRRVAPRTAMPPPGDAIRDPNAVNGGASI